MLVLAALCLRGPFAAVGPVLGELGDELSLSTGALAVVTSLPLVCFGLVSPFAPALAARLGAAPRRAGRDARCSPRASRCGWPGAVGLFAGTVLLSGGIAVVNVLLPAVARAEYGAPQRRRRRRDRPGRWRCRPASAPAWPSRWPTLDRQRAGAACALWLVPVAVALVGVGRAGPRPPRARRGRPRRPAGAPRSSATAWRWR